MAQSNGIATVDMDKQRAENIRATLASFSNEKPGSGLDVARHIDPKNKPSIPFDMDLSKAAAILAEAAKADQEMQEFSHTFRYRPWDGAVALSRVLVKYFGTTGRGKVIDMGFFGKIPPQQIDVEVGLDENGKAEVVQVPWGEISFVPLEGTLKTHQANDPVYGRLFQLVIECPKKYAREVGGFFNLLEEELKENSIYKGKAIRGTDNPTFIPLTTDPSIVYNDEVYNSLETTVWGVIREADLLSRNRIKTDPKILLDGPYGTGKSEAGRMTAKVAVDNGWTFIQFESGKANMSDLEKAFQTARLLAPAVVFVEDIDVYASQQDELANIRMLEMFGGNSSKGHEVLVLMTSNRKDAFNKGMLRTGRIDAMIEIGLLNRDATEKLIRVVCGDQLGDKVDFDKVFRAMDGYEPSFVRSTFDRARQSALIRHASELHQRGGFTNDKASQFKLDTDDFVTAANLLRPQHDLHAGASDLKEQFTLDVAFGKLLKKLLTTSVQFENSDIGVIEVSEIDPAEVH